MQIFSAFGVVLCVALHLKLGSNSAEVTVLQPLAQDTEDGPLKVSLESWTFEPIGKQKEVGTANNEEAVNEPDAQVVQEEKQATTQSVLLVLPGSNDDGSLKELQPSTESTLQALPECSHDGLSKGTLESCRFEPLVDEKEFVPTSIENSLVEPVSQSANEEEETGTGSPSTTTEAITYPPGLIDENAETTTNPSISAEEDDDLSDVWPVTDDDILVFTDADFPDGDIEPNETVNRLNERMLDFENFILDNKMKIN